MRFPYKVKVGHEIIPAGVDIPEEKLLGAAEKSAPIAPKTETVEREAIASEEPKKRGKAKK